MAEPFDEEVFGKRIAASLARPLCGYLVRPWRKTFPQHTRYARLFLVSSLRLSHDVNHLNEAPTSLVCLGNPPR
jgi:hypothetical protein